MADCLTLPGTAWAVALAHLEPSGWWQFRRLSRDFRGLFDDGVLGKALQVWKMEPDVVHGGRGGVQLTEAIRSIIRFADLEALASVCRELKRRGKAGLPWQLRSRELFLYAVSHCDDPAPMLAILEMAPQAIDAECAGRGYTALHEAMFCRRVRNAAALLSIGANAQAVNMVGETPLHIACFVVSPAGADLVEMLVAHDATLAEVADEQGRLPLDRFWEALARTARAEKMALEDGRDSAALRVLTLLDPTGLSLGSDAERATSLEALGIDSTAWPVAPVAPPTPARRRTRRRR